MKLNRNIISFSSIKRNGSPILKCQEVFRTPLTEVLNEILYKNGLSFIAFNPYSVFLINEAPDIIETIEKEPLVNISSPKTPEKSKNEIIIVGNAQKTEKGANVTLSGFIKDAENGSIIIGSTVYVEELKKGTISNKYGYYSLGLPPGSYHIAYNFIGLGKEVKQIVLNSSGTFNVELSEAPFQIDEVSITNEAATVNISAIQMSTIKLSMKVIETMPAFLGEVDVIKSLNLLPSVSTVGEGASGFNVRGGDIDQNLILLDDAPIYNSSHAFGFSQYSTPMQ